MSPPGTPKPSGAELAGTGFPTANPASTPGPAQPAPRPKAASKGGRPSKSGAQAIPVNVRLALDDHAALGRIAAEMHTPGRPVPTVQDIVRALVRGALADHAALRRLVREGGV